MIHVHTWAVLGLLLAAAAPVATARAGTEPLYQPAPAWVQPASLPAVTTSLPPLVVYDTQQRLENGRVWGYSDIVRRIVNAEELGKQTSLTLPWVPDKGDLIIHRLEILRGGEVIDLIAKGQRFTVLRREANLEQQMVTGVLTATLDVEGLRVGDMLRIAFSITDTDKALAGRMQTVGFLLPQPVRLGFGRLLLSWPAGKAPKVQALQPGISGQTSRAGGYEQVSFTLPVAKPAEIPPNAPGRFKRPSLVDVSSFADWADVSKTMAPLYATKGLIADGSLLKAEAAAIMAATSNPLERAQRALELVQDKVRYLAVQLNGGNYVPQPPEQTWSARYGDCKAKTLLLLALLREMGIEAEPVLAHTELGDLVSVRLPSALAFNHVLVRAVIGGDVLWLDGTSSGDRLPDIRDTPPFFNVLPLRPDGAALMPLKMHANARPGIAVDVSLDQSAALDLDPVATVKLTLIGRNAGQYNAVAAQLGPKETHDLIAKLISRQMGDANVGKVTATSDAAAGSVTLTANAVLDDDWQQDGQRFTLGLDKLLARIDWNVDRGRPAWAQIPVMADLPSGVAYRLSVKLPNAGRGISLDGTPAFDGSIRGEHLVRSVSLAGGVATMDERMDSSGVEIPASAIAAERDALAKAKASAPRLIASPEARRYWEVNGRDPAGATQIKAGEAVYADLIANDPEEASSWHARGNFRFSAGDYAGARADFTKAVDLAPTVDRHLSLSAALYRLNDSAGALAQAQAAHDLDPANLAAIYRLSNILAEQGKLADALALLDERIALGGENRLDLAISRNALQGEYGDIAEALAAFDTEIKAAPGKWQLYNAKCYMKAQRKQMLDSALADCGRSLELGGNAGVLDSRALVWAQLGQNDKALADLDAALALSPGLAESRFLRAVVLGRLGRSADSARDLIVARRIYPQIDAMFARYGIKAAK
ncbi:DUF3857 domain-containing protein [Sandarakinorhabdus oryzae]|uniref:DUF3857 domain-containing protein n=1 Tax=Sandarakinorhabdus oryzae TaxID=2675220 RepID=UPI001F48CA69|nr:DUF3857 domain-containing protein [Sandarakinorhabdus oryzae]